jgi:hypothetical protein
MTQPWTSATTWRRQESLRRSSELSVDGCDSSACCQMTLETILVLAIMDPPGARLRPEGLPASWHRSINIECLACLGHVSNPFPWEDLDEVVDCFGLDSVSDFIDIID